MFGESHSYSNSHVTCVLPVAFNLIFSKFSFKKLVAEIPTRREEAMNYVCNQHAALDKNEKSRFNYTRYLERWEF